MLVFWLLTYTVVMCSRFLDPEWLGQGDQVPRKEVPLVRL